MLDDAAVLLGETTRHDLWTGTEIVESRHYGHAVLVSGNATLAAVGDASRLTFHRSALKPFQATACLELLGARADELSPEEVAVSWASHRGEPAHLAAVRNLLDRSGTEVDALTCPADVGEADPCVEPSRLQHNCSGKHALFALTGQVTDQSGPALLAVDGPLQRSAIAAIAAACGEPLAVGVDGCGAPAVASSLAGLARGFAELAAGGRWLRVRDAGLAHPDLVGGEGRLESALLRAGVVAKVGAEGVYGVGFRRDGRTYGLAVKSEDGAIRASSAFVMDLLVRLDVVSAAVWSPPPILGGGAHAGSVRAATGTVTQLLTQLLDHPGGRSGFGPPSGAPVASPRVHTDVPDAS